MHGSTAADTARPPRPSERPGRSRTDRPWVRACRALVVAIALVAAAVARGDDAARGAALVAPFRAQLQEALQAGLKGGPAAAIGVCRVDAPRIAASLSRDGVRIGRTSHRLRNPANAGPDWARPLLDAYRDDAAARAPRVVAVAPGRVGYVEPIVTQAPCLLCHGEVLAAEVAATIAALYPADRAIGFRAGDLRGIFWVEMPATP